MHDHRQTGASVGIKASAGWDVTAQELIDNLFDLVLIVGWSAFGRPARFLLRCRIDAVGNGHGGFVRERDGIFVGQFASGAEG